MAGNPPHTEGAPKRTFDRIDVAFVSLVVVLAAGLRFYRLDAGLWADEVLTHEGASQSLTEAFLHRTPFLYYVLAHFSLLFGDTEIMLRLPSVLAGLSGVAALYGLARASSGRAVAFLAAGMLAISPYHVDKSQEARFYAFVMLANILMIWGIWRALSTGRRRYWVTFVLAANMGIAAQFTVVPYVVVLELAAFVCLISSRKRERHVQIRQWVYFTLACALSLSSLFVSILARWNFPYLIAAGAQTGETSAENLAYVNAYRLGPDQYADFLFSYIPRYWTALGYFFLAFVAIGAVILAVRKPTLAFLIATQVVFVPLPLFLVNVHHWYHERYFCCVYPFVPLLIAVAVVALSDGLTAWIGKRAPHGMALLRAISVVVFLAAYVKISSGLLQYHYNEGRPHNWRAVVQYLAPILEPGDTIAVAGPASYATQYLPKERQVFPRTHVALEFYLHRYSHAETLEAIRIIGAGSKKQIDTMSRLDHAGSVYLVIEACREPERAPHPDLAKIPKREVFRTNGLVVYEVEMPHPDASLPADIGDRAGDAAAAAALLL